MTPMDQADMMNRPTTTAFASEPICFHRDAGSQLTVLPLS